MILVEREIIRRLVVIAVLLAATGCATVRTADGGTTTVVLPVPSRVVDGNVYNRAGTGYYNPRWTFDPDSHPAVRPRAAATEGDDQTRHPAPSTRTAAENRADGQMVGGALGALAGSQAGNRGAGVLVGSAIGALVGGKISDPCAPAPNAGSAWGAIAGGLFGSLFGGGRGRDFFTALGAAGGAVRGTEMGSDGRRCR